MRENDYTIYLIVLIVPVLAAIVMIWNGQEDLDRAARQKATIGVVVSHEPSNHNSYGYRFEVDGHTYVDSDIPRFSEPRVGQQVTIYYDSADPTRNGFQTFAQRGTVAMAPANAILAFCFLVTIGILLFGPKVTEDRRKRGIPPMA